MSSNRDFKHKERVQEISYKLGIPKQAVEIILNLKSEYIKDKISQVQLDESNLLTEEEFNEQLPVIKIHPIGYMKPNYQKYKQIKNNLNKKKDGQLN